MKYSIHKQSQYYQLTIEPSVNWTPLQEQTYTFLKFKSGAFSINDMGNKIVFETIKAAEKCARNIKKIRTIPPEQFFYIKWKKDINQEHFSYILFHYDNNKLSCPNPTWIKLKFAFLKSNERTRMYKDWQHDQDEFYFEKEKHAKKIIERLNNLLLIKKLITGGCHGTQVY